MKPTNASERRGQFFRFILLFLLAMMPVIVVMYLMRRVDMQGYSTVRTKYNELLAEQESGSAQAELVEKVVTAGKVLNTNVTNLSPEMKEFKSLEPIRLKNDVDELKSALEALRNADTGAKSDQDIADLGIKYQEMAILLLQVYENGYTKLDKAQIDLKSCKDYEKEQLTPALETCQKNLDNCRAGRP